LVAEISSGNCSPLAAIALLRKEQKGLGLDNHRCWFGIRVKMDYTGMEITWDKRKDEKEVD
jgi:hypothetical protein